MASACKKIPASLLDCLDQCGHCCLCSWIESRLNYPLFSFSRGLTLTSHPFLSCPWTHSTARVRARQNRDRDIVLDPNLPYPHHYLHCPLWDTVYATELWLEACNNLRYSPFQTIGGIHGMVTRCYAGYYSQDVLRRSAFTAAPETNLLYWLDLHERATVKGTYNWMLVVLHWLTVIRTYLWIFTVIPLG
jgi:hypothetical protein